MPVSSPWPPSYDFFFQCDGSSALIRVNYGLTHGWNRWLLGDMRDQHDPHLKSLGLCITFQIYYPDNGLFQGPIAVHRQYVFQKMQPDCCQWCFYILRHTIFDKWGLRSGFFISACLEAGGDPECCSSSLTIRSSLARSKVKLGCWSAL